MSPQSLPATCSIRHGCPASGTLWALLGDPVARRVWQSTPRGDGLLAVFADDIAVVLRNVFRDWRRVRDALAELRRPTGLALHLGETVIVNFTRRGHLTAKGVACDGMPCVAAGVCKYLGVWLGPDAFTIRWRGSVCKLMSRARHNKTGLSCIS